MSTDRKDTTEDDSEAINLKVGQCVSDGNLNIKENMKAGTGIVFSEGKNYIDEGLSYHHSVKAEQMTLKSYKEKFVTNSEFQHRGITIEKQ